MPSQETDVTSRDLRIGHLVSLKNLGGVERYFTRFYTRHAPRHDHHVLLQTDDVHELLKPAYQPYAARIHSIKGPAGFKIPRPLASLRRRYQKRLLASRNIDAILVWNKIINHPLAFPDHLPLVHFERGSAWLAEDAASIRNYLARIDGVLCNSYAGLRILQLKWNVSESIPHQVLQNAISLPEVQSDHPEHRFRVGFAGRLTALKAPVVALESFAELKARCPHAEFWIAGKGPMEPILKEQVRHWGLEDSVRFCGLVDDMAEFYTSLDAFICPSWREPFGNVVQEALAYGVPTIAGDVDGMPELVSTGENGSILTPSRPRQSLAQYGDAVIKGPRDVYSPSQDRIVEAGVLEPAEVADCLEHWARNPMLRRQLGQKARDRVLRDFDLDVYGDRLATFMTTV